ncbi:MAG TPA: HD domain-containing phosphohydrolase [Clostridia bacterium]|nr:HD domain-containing phosphohydrolase [Clostridia bacterium]
MLNLSNTNEIGEIACAFNEIMCDLENSNKKLKTQSIELGILNSISKSITSTLDIDELSKLIVNEITGILGCPACILNLIGTGSSNLHTTAYSGSYFESSSNINQFEDEVFCQAFLMKSIKNHQIFTASEIRNLLCDKDLNEQVMPIQEFLFMPIKVKNKDIGVLSIGFSSEIKENDINLISSIATSVAVAIDNALLYGTSKKYFFNTIDALIAAVEAKDKYTEGHSQRVSQYATSVAKMLNLPKEQIEEIKIAGILHDIGKIGISDNILLKPEKLTSDEYEVIKQHPLISNKILYPVGFSDRTLKAIAFHHERYDGKGYPYGLSGNDITIEAQIIAVADAYDAMTSNRSYRCALGSDIALKELVLNKSTQFNPQLVDCMVEIMMTQRAC